MFSISESREPAEAEGQEEGVVSLSAPLLSQSPHSAGVGVLELSLGLKQAEKEQAPQGTLSLPIVLPLTT